MRYDYKCDSCKAIFETEKRMSDPDPVCPNCGKAASRYFSPDSTPCILFADRPPWTYKEAKKYKTTKYKGKEYKVDPCKHGDLGSWNSPGELIPEKKK